MKNKILIVVAKYYKDISLGLIRSARNELISKYKVTIIEVPGVFEIPITIKKNIKKYDGFIALGCVIKGQTPHFDFISKASTDAIMFLSIQYGKPISNGILTCLNKNQAKKRMNKGYEAAIAVKSVLSQG
mgnify:CR=1 FL=1|tara:strand:+ start:975 stop:1364 length:390 start_codon:yes stop_codon:yes gene_type:complete